METPQFSLVITGEWPGAGQSTTATALAKELHFTRVYAGHLQRTFAYIWSLKKDHLTLIEFEHLFETNQIKLADYPFDEKDFNENSLHVWQHLLRNANTPDVWDKIIDRQSLLALEKPGMVVEAKVGVLLDETKLVPKKKHHHQIFKFLLVCPPEISAHRVIKRKIENGELPPMDQNTEAYLDLIRATTTETINRHLRDWERYEKIYGIFRSDIYKPGIIKVSTAEKTEVEVVDTILNIIHQKLESSQIPRS